MKTEEELRFPKPFGTINSIRCSFGRWELKMI
jgi:hypothetical protein